MAQMGEGSQRRVIPGEGAGNNEKILSRTFYCQDIEENFEERWDTLRLLEKPSRVLHLSWMKGTYPYVQNERSVEECWFLRSGFERSLRLEASTPDGRDILTHKASFRNTRHISQVSPRGFAPRNPFQERSAPVPHRKPNSSLYGEGFWTSQIPPIVYNPSPKEEYVDITDKQEIVSDDTPRRPRQAGQEQEARAGYSPGSDNQTVPGELASTHR